MNVVKTVKSVSRRADSIASDRPSAAAETVGSVDGATRAAVIELLLTRGPSSASALAEELKITGTAVRRHLVRLEERGAVSTRPEVIHGPRGRGRPARIYLLTDSGRDRLPHAYDDLAADVIAFLARAQGEEAVAEFARHRAQRIVESVQAELDAAESVAARVRILAKALSKSGYVASVQDVGQGAQLSQHHCPVAHVAAKYPQFCEQELAVFSEVLRTHAQRVATIARGDSFCTTFVPDAVPEQRVRTSRKKMK